VRRDQRGSAKMITFTSSSPLYLLRIQTVKPLTVGVKEPKRIHEIPKLGTFAALEDAVEAPKRKASLSNANFSV